MWREELSRMWMRVVDYVCSKQVSGYDSSATATRFPLFRGTIGRLAPLGGRQRELCGGQILHAPRRTELALA